MPVRVTEKNGGMASGILRASARAVILVALVALAVAAALFLRS